MYPTLSGFKERASGALKFGGVEKFDHFSEPKHGYDNVGGGDLDSPTSFDEVERPPLRHIDKYVRAEICGLSARYTVSIMAMLGFMISFGMRCNLGLAKLVKEGEGSHKLKWSFEAQMLVDSSFFYGYLITQIPGGFLASIFPANRIFGAAIATSAFLNLFVPGAMSLDNVTVLFIIRVVQGLVEGVAYPACHGIWRFWAPPLERSRLATLAFCGSYAGIVIGLPLSGILAEHISWQAPFYFFSVAGMTWYVFWLWLVFERPRVHPTITLEEMKYIEKSLGESTQHTMPTIATTPWHDIVRSKPVYAIVVANFCRSWNFYMLVSYQSTYLKKAFTFNISEASSLGAIPHLIMTAIVPLGGMLADHLRKTGRLTTTNVRKLFNCGGFGMEGIFFFIVAHSTTAIGALTALTIGVAFSGFAISGYNVNHLDIAPRYASMLMGISNGIGSIAGILCPITIDYLTVTEVDDLTKKPGEIVEKERELWSVVFTIAALVHLFGITFYGIFASGELQPWAEPPVQDQPVWSPTKGGYTTETSFNAPALPTTQINVSSVNYGATGHVANNPFASSAPALVEENVQPAATDMYMHGSTDDRTY